MFKKFLKIFGICIAIITGIMGVSVGVFALTGGFNPQTVGMTKIFFGAEDVTEQELVIKEDTKFTISYLPDNATDLTLMCITNSQAVTVPATVKAGEEFTVVVNKDSSGRNIGGSAYIEFLSDSKSSESNLVKPCKLRLTVDVPVLNNDLEYNISLRRIDSALDPSVTTSQYIISKSATAEFDLESTKDNIFDTNKWNGNESKKTYFSYIINGKESQLACNTDSYFNDTTAPILAKYVTAENLYRFRLQPANISSSTMTFVTRTHRSYEIQKDFENYLYDGVTYNFDILRTGGELSGTAQRAYLDFLNKYETLYFANSSADASKFFNGFDRTTDNKIDINNGNNNNKINESLKYVFVSNSVSFYISDVTVSSLSVSQNVINIDLADISSENSSGFTFDEYYSILSKGTASGIGDKNARSLKSVFDIKVEATSNTTGQAVVEAAKESLLQGIEIKILVYDESGSYVKAKEYNKPTNNSNTTTTDNSNNNWAGFGASESVYDFGVDSTYLAINKDKNNIWKFTKKNISKPATIKEDGKDVTVFQIYLEFSLTVNDPSGEKIFYNYAKINIVDNSDAVITATEKSKNLSFQDTIYINKQDGLADTAFNNSPNKTNNEVMRVSEVKEPISNYGSIPYNSFKLFAYLGVENVEGENKSVNILDNYGKNNSVLAKNLYNGLDDNNKSTIESLYNIIDFDSSKLVTFQNLKGEYLYWTFDNNKAEQGFKAESDKAVTDTSKKIYAYEITKDEAIKIWQLNAQNASSNEVIIFGCYVLTNAAGRPINREGYELYQYDDNNNITGIQIIDEKKDNIKKLAVKYIYKDVQNKDVAIQYGDNTYPVVTYVSLSDIDFSHTMKSKMILEELYYYTFNQSAITTGDFSVAANGYSVRNVKENDNTRQLRLINNQSYSNILSVYPYDIEKEKEIDLDNKINTAITLLEKNNLTLAFYDAIASGRFNFVVYNNQQSTIADVATLNTEANVSIFQQGEVTINNETIEILLPAPITISITTNAATDVSSTTSIRVSNDYDDVCIYKPTDAVNIKISNIEINDFDSLLYYTTKENVVNYNDTLSNLISANGKIVANSNENWNWVTKLFDERYGLPRIYSVSEGILELGMSKDDNGNITIGGTIGRVETNLLNGVTVTAQGSTQYTYNFSNNPIVDYSLISEDYLNYCIATYLFELTGCDKLATYEPIVTLVNKIINPDPNLSIQTDVVSTSNALYNALTGTEDGKLNSESTIYQIAIQYANIIVRLQESIVEYNSDKNNIPQSDYPIYNSNNVNYYLPEATGAASEDNYINIDAVYTFDDLKNAIIAMAKSDYGKGKDGKGKGKYYYDDDNNVKNLFEYIVNTYDTDKFGIYNVIKDVDEDNWKRDKLNTAHIPAYILYSYNNYNSSDPSKQKSDFVELSEDDIKETFAYRYEYYVQFVLEHEFDSIILSLDNSTILYNYKSVYANINAKVGNIRLQQIFDTNSELSPIIDDDYINNGFKQINLVPTITDTNEFAKYFNGTYYNIVKNNQVVGLSVKLNSDGTFPLSEYSIDPIVFVNGYTLWKFNNVSNPVKKYYQITAEFTQPVFEFNGGTVNTEPDTGIKYITVQQDIKGGGEYTISGVFSAHNYGGEDTELLGNISYVVDNSNYAYFVVNNSNRGAHQGYNTDSNTTAITFAPTFEDREVVVTCTLGKTILKVKFVIAHNLTATDNLSSAKFVSYNSNATFTGANTVTLSDPAGGAEDITLSITDYEINDTSIKYNLSSLFSVDGGHAVEFELASKAYQDFRGEWNTYNDSNVSIAKDQQDNYYILKITGEFYTALRLNINVKYDDAIIANPTITIYSVVKMEVNGLTAVDNNGSFYYRYASANGDIITNGYNLYGDNGLVKLSCLTQFEYIDNTFTTTYTTVNNPATNLTYSLLPDDSAGNTVGYTYKWSYGLTDSGFVVRDQFLTKSGDTYNQTNLGKILFNKNGNAYSINNKYVSIGKNDGVITLAALDQSFVLPITISISAAVNNSITILIPFAGYKFTYLTNSGNMATASMAYDSANDIYSFAFDQLIANAGSTRLIMDDIVIAYADNTADILSSATIGTDSALLQVEAKTLERDIAYLGAENQSIVFNELAGQDNVSCYPIASINITGYNLITSDEDTVFPKIKGRDGQDYNNIIFTYIVKPSINTTLATDGDYIVIKNSMLTTGGITISNSTKVTDFIGEYFEALSTEETKTYELTNVTSKSFDYLCDGYGVMITFNVDDSVTLIDAGNGEFGTTAGTYSGNIVVRGKGGTLSSAIPFTITITITIE